MIDLPEFTALWERQARQDEKDRDAREIREAFEMLDTNGDGLISAEELQAFFVNKLGVQKSLSDAQKMIDGKDKNGDGMIDLSEFIALMQGIKRNTGLKSAFHTYDTNGDGRISRTELCQFFETHQRNLLSKEQLDSLMKELDTNEEGEIDYEEFKKMMKNYNA